MEDVSRRVFSVEMFAQIFKESVVSQSIPRKTLIGMQEKAQAHNVFTADESFARAKVVLRWNGWSSQQVRVPSVGGGRRRGGGIHLPPGVCLPFGFVYCVVKVESIVSSSMLRRTKRENRTAPRSAYSKICAAALSPRVKWTIPHVFVEVSTLPFVRWHLDMYSSSFGYRTQTKVVNQGAGEIAEDQQPRTNSYGTNVSIWTSRSRRPACPQVTLHTEFNAFRAEGMGEDQSRENPGHEAVILLSPGTYKYYFTVDDRRRYTVVSTTTNECCQV